jgi:hypothetical protein
MTKLWLYLSSSLVLLLPGVTQSFNLPASPVEAWDSYNAALEASPLFVKSVTAGVILGAADLSGQALEASLKEKDDNQAVSEDTEIDWARAARFAFFGLVLQAVSFQNCFSYGRKRDSSVWMRDLFRFLKE